MALTLYNTKTRSIEPFVPLHGNQVSMYACGLTVYDYTHIGHLRKYIGDDILRRTLQMLGYEVKHVMNVTDVGHLTDDSDTGDDKFEHKAQKEGKTVWNIAAFYTDYFHTSMKAVHVLPPTVEAPATKHIPEMIALIEVLLAKGFAYETSTAVYFDVLKDEQYGKLSRQKIEEKIVAARDEVVDDKDKHHPADFVLWFKRVGRFENHTMHWPSPWGDGFPGWHIECSAMSMHYLGETIDIHTGGIDHIPVHHENEIAQSECATGHEFVRFWVHHDFLLVDGEKMSKSKQNFYTIDDIKEKGIDPLATRLLFMQTSYRKSLNFTWESLVAADALLTKLKKFAARQERVGIPAQHALLAFKESLEDDLNTAKALAVVLNVFNDPVMPNQDKWATLLYFDTVLGLDLEHTPKFVLTDDAKDLIQKRDEARKQKDFVASDVLRKELENLGYEVVDTPEGTTLQ